MGSVCSAPDEETLTPVPIVPIRKGKFLMEPGVELSNNENYTLVKGPTPKSQIEGVLVAAIGALEKRLNRPVYQVEI